MRRLAIIGVTILAFLALASTASAHGPRASFIQPAWDCYRGTNGDIAVIHDRDKNRYIKWRCTCNRTAAGKLYCYWRVVSITRARPYVPSNTRLYGQAEVCPRRVKFLAWHDGRRVLHIRSRFWLIHVRHK